MKKIFAAAVLGAMTLAGSMSFAINGPTRVRIYAPSMTCAQVKEAVQTHGAVIVYSSPSIYERIVSGSRYCDSGFGLNWTSVTSAEGKCYAGYACERRENGRD